MTFVVAQAKGEILQDFSKDLVRSPVTVVVKNILGPDIVQGAGTDMDGTVYRLVGIDIPEPYAEDAATYLNELAKNQKCTLYQSRQVDKGRINRMGQALVHMECGDDNVWLQGNLLAKGFARVRTTPANAELADVMLKIEGMARSKKRGMWAHRSYAVLTSEQATQKTDGFHLVEGQVYAVGRSRDMLFINFKQDWKTDFSIGIPNALLRDFSMAQIPIQSLRGQYVRVRGWLRDYNGPYIELDHITPLEILGNTPPTHGIAESAHDATPAAERVNPSARKPSTPDMMHTIKRPMPPTAPELPPLEPAEAGTQEK